MAPFQFIDRPSPFNTKNGRTLPIFAITPAHIETGTIDEPNRQAPLPKDAPMPGSPGSISVVGAPSRARYAAVHAPTIPAPMTTIGGGAEELETIL